MADDSQEALVNQVKELQRNDANAKEQWIAYTDFAGQGKRDPNKHSAEFLKSFLMQLSAGARFPAPEDSVPLAETVKLMQKKSTSFKNVWAHYCLQFGGGRNDPLKHDNAYHVKFLDCLAQQACMSLALVPALVEQPAKRMRDASGMPWGTSASGDSSKDQLVVQVKAFQRQGEAQKDLWGRYADTYLGGVRDPSRHDAATLQEFCTNHGVPPVSGGESSGRGSMGVVSMSVVGGMGMGDGSSKDQLVQQIKSFQRQGEQQKELWGTYADTYLNGIRDPARHDASTLQEFCQNHGVPPISGGGMGPTSMSTGGMGTSATDPAKEVLVQRIKQYQKSGNDQRDEWHNFAGSTRDPARHDVNKLQEFISLYNVP